MEALSWKENTDTDVYVINRNTGDVRHLTTQPMYSLHHANAYQINKVESRFFSIDLQLLNQHMQFLQIISL